MSWFQIIIVGLIVFLSATAVSELFRIKDVKPAKKLYRPNFTRRNFECREYWSPEVISQRFNENAVKNENMAALDGYHTIEQLDNVIIPIVPQWYQRNNWERQV